MQAANDIVVEVRGLVNRFGRQVVHDGLDLTVRRGEVFGILGGSAAASRCCCGPSWACGGRRPAVCWWRAWT